MINLFTAMFISMKPAELHYAVQPLDFVWEKFYVLFTLDPESIHIF